MTARSSLGFLGLIALGALFQLGCSGTGAGNQDNPPAPPAGAGTGGSGVPGGSGGASTVGGSSGSGSSGAPNPGGGGGTGGMVGTGGTSGSSPLGALPFTVDDFFVPSGFMGDGEMPGNVSMLPDVTPESDRTCGGDRPIAGALGICHVARYAQSGGMLWAGVFWQNPEGNWGSQPGFPIPSGATRVTFYAKGSVGGEVVKFIAGIMGELQYADSFAVEQEFTLSTEWTGYSLALNGATYNNVIGAFGWVASGDPAGGVTLPLEFKVDHIQWE